jgi:hypothetical protein
VHDTRRNAPIWVREAEITARHRAGAPADRPQPAAEPSRRFARRRTGADADDELIARPRSG